MLCKINKAPRVAAREAQTVTPATAPNLSKIADTSNPELLYAKMETPGAERGGMIQVTPAEAGRLNKQGYGIFWAVNRFNQRRIKAMLRRIRAWHVDVDLVGPEREKAAALDRILRGALEPSCIVETKNGYHAYWIADGSPSLDWHGAICRALATAYDGDQNAIDVCRLLRVPGYFHWKSGTPYEVRIVHRAAHRFAEAELIQAFGVSLPPPRPARAIAPPSPVGVGLKRGDFDFEAMRAANQGDLLARLSGHAAVGGETYSFRPRARGGEVISVNGAPSSAWIDEAGRIGSLSKGGPSVYDWLAWFGHRPAEVMSTLREVFPEFIAGANCGGK